LRQHYAQQAIKEGHDPNYVLQQVDKHQQQQQQQQQLQQRQEEVVDTLYDERFYSEFLTNSCNFLGNVTNYGSLIFHYYMISY